MTVAVVMGVAGSGKSTVGKALAQRLGWVFGEGDELHSAAKVAKMARGEPLTDADREPWLRAVRGWIEERIAAGESAVIACSALRRRYRDVLRSPAVVFVYLHAEDAVLRARLAARAGHFMHVGMLDSQLATLEPPEPDERAITVDVASPGAVDRIVDTFIRVASSRPGPSISAREFDHLGREDATSPRQSGAEDSSQETKPV